MPSVVSLYQLKCLACDAGLQAAAKSGHIAVTIDFDVCHDDEAMVFGNARSYRVRGARIACARDNSSKPVVSA
ncbi:MAG TPA: hypothetical protein VHK27_07225 [Gammaproteobacteria bacterium]|nr:hypothetical protein [Gammaproteobacteria bacterium]